MDAADATAKQETLMRSATIAAVAVALVLIVGKLIVWRISGSVVVLSSLVDSLLDSVASIVNFLAVRQALIPPDREHRFGHGKFEALAGLAQAVIIAGAAVYIVFEAVQHFVAPEPPKAGALSIAVMLGSMALTLGLVLYQRFVVRHTGSVAVAADSLHYLSDILTNGAVILALVLTIYFGFTWADPVFAIAIAIFILASSRKILMSSLDIMLDRELPDAERKRIKDIVRAHDEVIGMHDLKTRSAGVRRFIQFHIELEPEMTIAAAHDIMVELESEILVAFPGANVLIHTDPLGVDEPRQIFD